jgi:hypothetical protein
MFTIIQKEGQPKPDPMAVSSNSARFNISFPASDQNAKSVAVSVDIKPIPESFWRGLADCESGRVVDMERAMKEKPPGIN